MSVARMTFVEIKQIIKRGNLAVLGRSSKDQSAYDTFTANIQKEWQSMSSYLLCTKMGIPSFVNDEGMKEANIPKSQPVQFHLLKNDFPYNFEVSECGTGHRDGKLDSGDQ